MTAVIDELLDLADLSNSKPSKLRADESSLEGSETDNTRVYYTLKNEEVERWNRLVQANKSIGWMPWH